MLDYALMGYLPGSIYSDRMYPCQVCGHKSLMTGDGFLMTRCMNCGRFQHAIDSVGMDFSWLQLKIVGLWKRIRERFTSAPREALKVNFESGGGIQ
ncbi:MAG: hypothetical protein AB7T49_20175 [Oligoflexales bacterium]